MADPRVEQTETGLLITGRSYIDYSDGKDPFVREIGRLADDAGRILIVGVSYGGVTLRTLHTRTSGAVELSPALAEEFAQLYLSACWAAARDGERLLSTTIYADELAGVT